MAKLQLNLLMVTGGAKPGEPIHVMINQPMGSTNQVYLELLQPALQDDPEALINLAAKLLFNYDCHPGCLHRPGSIGIGRADIGPYLAIITAHAVKGRKVLIEPYQHPLVKYSHAADLINQLRAYEMRRGPEAKAIKERLTRQLAEYYRLALTHAAELERIFVQGNATGDAAVMQVAQDWRNAVNQLSQYTLQQLRSRGRS